MAEKVEETPKISTLRVELDGRYAGWWADCDDDPDGAFLEDFTRVLATGQFGPTWEALLRVVVAWNFKEKSGAVVPVSVDGMRAAPAKALLELSRLYMEAWRQLPN